MNLLEGEDAPFCYDHGRFARLYREVLRRGLMVLTRRMRESYDFPEGVLNGGMMWKLFGGFSLHEVSKPTIADAVRYEKAVRRFVRRLEVMNVGCGASLEEAASRTVLPETVDGEKRVRSILFSVAKGEQKWNDWELVAALEGISDNISFGVEGEDWRRRAVRAVGGEVEDLPTRDGAVETINRLVGALYYFRKYLIVEGRGTIRRDWVKEFGEKTFEMLKRALLRRLRERRVGRVSYRSILPGVCPHIHQLRDGTKCMTFELGGDAKEIAAKCDPVSIEQGIHRFCEAVRKGVGVGRWLMVQREGGDRRVTSQDPKERIEDAEMIDLLRDIAKYFYEDMSEKERKRAVEIRTITKAATQELLAGSERYQKARTRVY